ncbi:hypothetical protein C5167_021635 [Papaver somniferum]|uniref:kinesin-like protein KIN-14R n=1 Tax=Papaver somniferum TaxID=3469 RepID=UPI000E7012AB|nr:kinesin-like protein KIN-14R [Papaver somniferum]RZC91926.1 hypothetical protein C5167_021635 [Papaver somniferum]
MISIPMDEENTLETLDVGSTVYDWEKELVSDTAGLLDSFHCMPGSRLVPTGFSKFNSMEDFVVPPEYLTCKNCSTEIEVPYIQKKSTAMFEKKIKELTSQCQMKTNEYYEASMSLTAANEQLEKVRTELDGKMVELHALDKTMEKQAAELNDVSCTHECDKKSWVVAINDLERKIKIMKTEQSQVSHEAHECANSIPDLNQMVSAVQALVAECDDLKSKYLEEQTMRKKLYNQLQESKVEPGPAKKQVDNVELQKLKTMLDKVKQESRSKDESLIKLEDNLQNLEIKARSKDQLCKSQLEKVKELEAQIDSKMAAHKQSEKQVWQLNEKLKGREEICSGLQHKVKELESKLKEGEHMESSALQQKIKVLEIKLKEKAQQQSDPVDLQQKVKELENKLKDREQNADSALLHQKNKELEVKLREREQQLKSTPQLSRSSNFEEYVSESGSQLKVRRKRKLSNGPSSSLVEKNVRPVEAKKARLLPVDPKALARVARTAKTGNVSRLSSHNKKDPIKERDKTRG